MIEHWTSVIAYSNIGKCLWPRLTPHLYHKGTEQRKKVNQIHLLSFTFYDIYVLT